VARILQQPMEFDVEKGGAGGVKNLRQ
jgi:hypothetical protein